MSGENGLYYATNQGALLRRMFPKQLNSQARVIIWVIIFILDMIAIVLIQNLAIFKITDISKEGLSELSYFENCEIAEIHEEIDVDEYRNIYYVKYINESKETRIVCLEKYPEGIFQRYRLKKATDCAVDDEGMILYENGKEINSVTRQEYVQLSNPISAIYRMMILQPGRIIQNLAVIYIGCGLVLLGIEFFFYSVFHRLFRS